MKMSQRFNVKLYQNLSKQIVREDFRSIQKIII